MHEVKIRIQFAIEPMEFTEQVVALAALWA